MKIGGVNAKNNFGIVTSAAEEKRKIIGIQLLISIV